MKRGKLVLRVLVSGGLLALLLWILPAGEIWSSLRGFAPWVWACVLVGFLAGHRVGVEKWRLLVRAGGAPLGRREAVTCYASGLFANLYLPTIVGGDVLRATLAARRAGRTEAVVVGSLGDRAVDVASLAVLIAAGGLVTGTALEGTAGRVVLAAAVAGLVAAAVALPLILRTPLRRWPRRLRRPVGRALVALRRLAREPGTAAAALGLSLAMQSGFVLLNAWIGAGVGIDVPLSAWFLVWPLAKGVALLPVSIGGLGVRDATLGALLVPLGVPMDLGVAASFVWQSVLVAGGLVAGLVWRVGSRGADGDDTLREDETAARRGAAGSLEHV